MADLSVISGKTMGGDGGEGVLIESVAVKFDSKKDGTPIAAIEINGVAKTALIDPYNPAGGFTELPEPVPVTHTIDIPVDEGGVNRDLSINFSQLNRAFDFEDPLVDRLGEWERFMEDGENSVYQQIVGKKAYFSARPKDGKTGDKVDHYWVNIIGLSKRIEPKAADVKKRIEALRKKRKAEMERKEKAASEGMATVGADSDPIPF